MPDPPAPLAGSAAAGPALPAGAVHTAGPAHPGRTAAPDVPRPPDAGRARVDLGARLARLRDDPRAGALALAAVALGAGAFWFRAGTAPAAPSGTSAASVPSVSAGPPVSPVPSVPPVPDPAATTTTVPGAAGTVVVHVAGAVRRPGVVTLPAGARVVDAVEAAGGARPRADLDALNLAAPLTDGERVLVTRVGEPPPAPPPAAPPAGEPAVPSPAAPLDLNAASAEQLETLPGIGPALAAAILAERARLGAFTDVAQLQQVRGIGDVRYAQLQGLVTV